MTDDCEPAPGYPLGFGIVRLPPRVPGECHWRQVTDCFPPTYSPDPELTWGGAVLTWDGEPIEWAAAP